MPLTARVVQADLRGTDDNVSDKAIDDLESWLENDAPGAPIGNTNVANTGTQCNDDILILSTVVTS
jgi:hypothetical protein